MRKILLTLALSTLLLAPAATANAQVTFGIRIGQQPAPRGYVVPARPGPEYSWVEGYWYPQGGRYAWHNGYWTRPPYEGAYWVAPYAPADVMSPVSGKATAASFRMIIVGTKAISATRTGIPAPTAAVAATTRRSWLTS